MLENCKTAKEAETISKNGQEMFAAIENSNKPFVAGIMGQCLGGGLEVRNLILFLNTIPKEIRARAKGFHQNKF